MDGGFVAKNDAVATVKGKVNSGLKKMRNLNATRDHNAI